MAKTDDTGVMLKAILNGLCAFKLEFLSFKKEVLHRFDEMDKKFDNKIDGVEERLTKRIDSIDKQLAYLEDDAPRVHKIEQKALS